MSYPQARVDLERILNAVDARAALVILVGDNGELETAARGINNPEALFDICWSVARQIAAEIYDNMPAEQQRQAKLVLPTAEDARRLGIMPGAEEEPDDDDPDHARRLEREAIRTVVLGVVFWMGILGLWSLIAQRCTTGGA